MGLLDDAIREHLELKRRHGADVDEVERQEREALGAPPRDEATEAASPEAPEAPQPGRDDAVEAPPAADVDDAPGEPEDAAATSSADADELDPPTGEEEVPRVGHEADAPGYDEDPWLDVDEDETASEGAQPAPEPPTAEQLAGEEDVLEETPEFLQETPEHDRLWFEQKPPRDFDWDR